MIGIINTHHRGVGHVTPGSTLSPGEALNFALPQRETRTYEMAGENPNTGYEPRFPGARGLAHAVKREAEQ
jgi:hypothetical protein